MLHTLTLKPKPYSDAEAVEAVRLAVRQLTMGHGRILRIVHGYGSGGLGGSNREAVRAWLQGELDAGRIRRFIPGESLLRGDLADFKRRFPGHDARIDALRPDCGNAGVSLVLAV